ncbi:hypothetical protein F5887DRAFT_1175044 [Amanita rubescens]|nr:hypothetical protein F5887DRAFT_1175044 [Amanita rubescens]
MSKNSDLHSIFSDYDKLTDSDSDLHSIFSDYDKLTDDDSPRPCNQQSSKRHQSSSSTASTGSREFRRDQFRVNTAVRVGHCFFAFVPQLRLTKLTSSMQPPLLADQESVEGSEDGSSEVDVNEGRKQKKVAPSRRKTTSSVWGVLFLFCHIEVGLLSFFIFSVCDENAVYSALADANALTLLVPKGDKTAKLSRLGDDDAGSCLWSLHYCGLTVQCNHTTNPEPSCFVLAGCSVLNFLGLYWSPVLTCLVCPEERRVVPGASLEDYLKKRNIKDCPLNTLLQHLSSFAAIGFKDDLETLYNCSLRSINVDRPIPGLQYDAHLTHYRCPECFKWCTTLSGHFQTHHSTLSRSRSSGNRYIRQLSIVLDSSKPTLRIPLLIAGAPKPEVSGPHLDAISSESPKADSDRVERWMSLDFRNPTGPTAPTLISGPSDGSYMFTVKGGDDHCLHLDSGWGHSDMMYTGCAVLSFFQCFYSPVLHAIVNPRNQRLLHSDSFKRHIKNRSNKYKPIADELHDHVAEAFDLWAIFTAEELYKKVHQSLILPAPILGLRSPKCRYWCSDCKMSYTTPIYHVKKHHGPGTLATKKGVERVDVIVLWKEPALSEYTVRVAANPCLLLSPHKPVVVSFDEAPHLEESGINALVMSWGEFDVQTVLSLVLMPSEYVPSDEESQPGSLAFKSEAFLKAFHKVTGSYLCDAQRLIQERHQILRKALNGFSTEGGDRIIHDVSDETILACRSSSTRALSVALRYTYKTINQRNVSSPALLGKFSLSSIMGMDMNRLIQDLVRHINKTQDVPDENFLMHFLHRFLVESFTEKLPDSKKIASLWELSTLLANMRDNNNKIAFKSPEVTLTLLSHSFRTARSVLVHCAVAGSFTPSELKHPRSNTETPESDTAIRFLEAQQQYLDPGGGDYLYGRLRAIWRCALPYRKEEPYVSDQSHWSGSTLIFSWRFISDKHIEVQQFRKQVFYHVRQHERIFMNLFPTSFIPHLETIQIPSFVDDEGADSIFSIPKNQMFLSPLVEKLIKCLEEEGISKNQVFQRSQEYLFSLLTIIYTTTGTPPRAFQLVDFRYATSGMITRNFRLVDQTHGVFVGARATNSRTSPKSSTPIDMLWLLTREVTRTLLVFLGVYRPVVAFYAAKAPISTNSDFLQPLDTHIFCNPGRKQSIIWSVDNVEDHLKKNSPLQVEAYAHSLIMTQITSRFFKPLLNHLESAVLLDKQSQHATHTSRHHYAVDRLQNVTGSQYCAWEKHVMLGQAVHAFFYLSLPIANLEVHGHTLQILEDDVTDVEDALYVARHAIMQTYQLAALPAEKVSVKVRFLMNTLPRFYHDTKQPVPTSEQQILSEVAQALKDSDDSEGCPLGADDAQLRRLAKAGILVSDFEMQKYIIYKTEMSHNKITIALSEWTTGELVPCSGRLILSLGDWAPKVESLLSDLRCHKEQHPNSFNWIMEKDKILEDQDAGEDIVLNLVCI